MAQIKFGGPHTVQKLNCLEKYLKAYLKVFKNRPNIRTIYVDAFAGTGEVPQAANYDQLPLDEDAKEFIVGSARRALSISDTFHEYIFIEKQRGKALALRQLRSEFPGKAISILNNDANGGLKQLCSTRDWRKSRAVVFLDPFGSQVEWSTIETLAATKAVDLWYLFPAGLSVHRQISREGNVHASHEAALDRLLGDSSWRHALIEERAQQPDLFGEAGVQNVKTATPESVTRFMIQRMQAVFGGGVLDEWLSLGRNNAHWYSLLFAWANPDPKAAIAGNIARSVIRSGKRGRSK